jgi:hypothetical protein
MMLFCMAASSCAFVLISLAWVVYHSQQRRHERRVVERRLRALGGEHDAR